MRKKKLRNLNYKADLIADLRASAEFAAEYLSAAHSDSRGAFLVALRDVVEARKGIAKVAAQAKVNRESLYRCLSDVGNPTLSTLNSIWDVLGLEIEFKPRAVKPKVPVTLVGPFEVAANAAASTTATEFRTVTTVGNEPILTSPTVTTPDEQPSWAYAGTLLPGFIANVTRTDQSTISAFGD
jgi:probable addiction module antidote protein